MIIIISDILIDHVLIMCVILEEGKLFACGDNQYQQLGIGASGDVYDIIPIPYFEDQNIKVLDIECGREHAHFITTDGVYASGT